MQYFKMEIWEFILGILNSIRLKKTTTKQQKKTKRKNDWYMLHVSWGIKS